MGRETLLTLLLLIFGGLTMQPFMLLPEWRSVCVSSVVAERRAWRRLWLPVVPMLIVSAGLCGWALREPDPVRARFDHGMLIAASLPFAVLALRAALRAGWALLREPLELPICTVGLWRPRIVFDPYLARILGEAQVHAAMEHERAHARHRDPLRIWLAQLATDVQWPWPWAARRFEAWLELLEHARDDEARRLGASGAELAAAVVATARHVRRPPGGARAAWMLDGRAALLGDAHALAQRVQRLLAPMPDASRVPLTWPRRDQATLTLIPIALAAALLLGALFGNAVLHPFLLWTWNA